MNDQQLLRYSRHILLPQIDISGQEKLTQSSVLIIGAGGLGSPAALYLAASGVGTLIICDNDTVELTNLQRQIIHHTNSIGQAKSESAQQTLTKINPEVNVIALQQRVDDVNLQELVRQADAVVDASDNFKTRHQINNACVTYQKPLISGAAVRFEGQVSVFDLRKKGSPCYHCLYPTGGEEADMPCAIMGIFAPLVGIIGSMQAAETLKILLGLGKTLNGRLQLLNSLTMDWRSIKLIKDPACSICSIDNKKST